MNPSQKQLLRHAILLQLESSCPASLPVTTILHGVTLAGHPVTELQLKKELLYLADKNLLSVHPQTLSPALLRYKLSASGRDYLEEQGLA